jgi:hypothetical protein
MSIFKKRPMEDVETELARSKAHADAAGHAQMVRRLQRNAERDDRAAARRVARAERRRVRRERAEKVRTWVEALRQRMILVLPLIGVNALALGGQVGFATDHLGWGLPQAILFGAVLESIALYIGWHAHQALMSGDSAIKLKAASYLMGAVVGGLNYDHFSGPDWSPTTKSVVFGMLSMVSPWLWAMHGRHANRKRLRELGLVDERAPHFSGGRWVHFPVQTWGALRWGIANNIQDPTAAWAGYQRARLVKAERKDKRTNVRVTVVRELTVKPTNFRTGFYWVTDASGATLALGHQRGANTRGGHSLPRATRGANVPGPQHALEAGATNGATSGATEGGHEPSSDVAPKPDGPAAPLVGPANDGGRLIEFTPRGKAQAAMRAHWDTTIADGFIPNGADLNRAANKDPKYSLGKKYAKAWGEELPEEFVEAVKAGRHEDAREIAAGFSAGERKEAAT